MARYLLKNDNFIHLLINQYVLKLKDVEVLAVLTSVLNTLRTGDADLRF